ncbi:MAG: glutathione S-transferase C-terminal domain-containing protein [Alphaproteobacteria bacterium]
MAITFYKFGEAFGLPDPSPFCLKLESFMRINDIAFELGEFDAKSTLGKAPKKKIPFVVFENGEKMGDSTLIIDRLSKDKNIDMDAPLTASQCAQSHAFRRMLDESTYFCGLYSRWIDDNGWAVVKPLFFGNMGMPGFLSRIISNKIRGDVIKKAVGQGIARHTKEEVYSHGAQDFQSLSGVLGGDQWFFGTDTPNLLDLWAHAYVIEAIHPTINNALKDSVLKMDNLVQHAYRLHMHIYDQDLQQKNPA